MKLWLIGMGLALLGIVHVMAEETIELDHERVLGVWHVLAMATDCQKFLKNKDFMKIVAATVSKTDQGDLKFASNFPMPEGCKKVEMVFTKGEDGKLVHRAAWGMKTVDKVETDYDDFAIATYVVEKKGKDKASNMVVLYARNQHVTPAVEQKFIDAVKAAGLTEEQTIIFPKEVACTGSE